MPSPTKLLDMLMPTLRLLEDAVAVTAVDAGAAGPSIVFVNEAFAKLTGFTAEELAGAPLPLVSASEGAPDRLRWLVDAMNGGEPYVGETLLRGRDGRTLRLQAQIAPLFDERGTVRHWLGLFRADAGATHRASEDVPYRRVVENQPDLICCFRPDTTLTYVNAAYAVFFGCRPDDLIGRPFLDLIPPEDRATVAANLAAATPAEPSRHYEHRAVRVDGEVRWHLWNDLALFDDDGTLVSFQSVGTDITLRKQLEEALSAEKERAEVTLHSIGDAVITTDALGRVEYVNPVAEALTGWSAADARGLALDRVFRLIEEETREPIPDPVLRCLAGGQTGGSATHAVLIGRSGQEHPIAESVAPMCGRDGRVRGAVLVFRDVAETRRMARRMAHEASHDPLTDLVNRREFERRLERALASARQYGSRHALCYLDLDQFKLVNDTAGHAAGDALLKQVRGLLAGKFRDRDTLARLGGDEFGLLLDNCSLPEALKIGEIIVAAFADFRFAWQGRAFDIGVSIGVVPVAADMDGATHLLSQADVACYTAKQLGRNRVHVYRREGDEPPDRHARALRAANLRHALDQDRFRLYCQPIVPLSRDSGAPVRFEFLLRLLDTDGELIWPRAFIPAAERFGLMRAIDRWVIRTAFRHCAERFDDYSRVEIAINLSGNSLDDGSLLRFVRDQFADFALPPERVCFEITETAAFSNFSQTFAFAAGVKDCGSLLALDDFGRGMSSFSHLKSLPVDYLKIDGGFVRDMMVSTVDHDLVEAINQVGHIMGIKTIAEYAHSTAIVERLKELGVDGAQGDAIGLPVPLIDATPERALALA